MTIDLNFMYTPLSFWQALSVYMACRENQDILMRWYSVTHFSYSVWYANVLHTEGEVTCCYSHISWYMHMIGHSFTYLPSLLLLLQLTIQPEDLLPHLPNPKDLQPFPTVMSMVYEGHTDMVRSIAVEPKGQYMVSGSDDLTVKGKTSLAYFTIADKILARSGCYYLQTFTLLTSFI